MNSASSSVILGLPATSGQGLTQTQQAKVAKDLQDIAAALKASNAKAAEKALLQLQIDSTPAGSSSSASAGTNPLSKVASALRAGNLAEAKKEFAAFETAAAQALPSPASPSSVNATSTRTALNPELPPFPLTPTSTFNVVV